jgi:4-amino-4-deoxy-L-arabinose transferase-like glycosyltransferase
LGNGHPAIAAVFISLLESLTIPAIYFFVARYHNQKSALLASFIWSFSYYLIRSSRWFSNPTPIPFFVISLMYCLSRVFIDKKPKYLIPFAFLLGLSLQLEAA